MRYIIGLGINCKTTQNLDDAWEICRLIEGGKIWDNDNRIDKNLFEKINSPEQHIPKNNFSFLRDTLPNEWANSTNAV